MTGRSRPGCDRADKLGRFFAQRQAAQSAGLIERRRNRGVIQRRVRRDESSDAVLLRTSR